MIRLIFIFVTFFVLDNLLILFLPIQPLVESYSIIPNAFLSCLCLFTFYDRGTKYSQGIKSFDSKGNKSYIFALIFGILYDIYYAGMLGLYTCLFLIIVYLIRRFFVSSMPINILSMIALMTGVIIFEEWVVFFIVSTIINLNVTSFQFIQYTLFPSLLFNALLMLFIYPLLSNQFKKYQQKLD